MKPEMQIRQKSWEYDLMTNSVKFIQWKAYEGDSNVCD